MCQRSCRLNISEDNHTAYSPERKEANLQKMVPPHSLTVAELASQEGISTATLYDWRKAACMGASALSDEQAKQSRQAAKAEKKRVKKFEAELLRKEKALAETAALLTLSKKAEANWGPKDEDE